MPPPSFVYAIGDCVEVIAGRSAGVKGYVTQIKKDVIVVKAKRKTCGVRARSIVLRKKSNMLTAPNLCVATDAITEFIRAKTRDKNIHMISLGEWRRLQKHIEQALFDTEK